MLQLSTMENYHKTLLDTGMYMPNSEPVEVASFNCVTSVPTNLNSIMSDSTPNKPTIPLNITQAIVDADPNLKRFQQNLLILTSFNENETLHWRPSRFIQSLHSTSFWALYNPPNVVTEQLPHTKMGRLVYTRRMRHPEDPVPSYIKTWDQWHSLCAMRGIPQDFLCEEQVHLMTLVLPKNEKGVICAPPIYPLYPEPQPVNQGRHMLNPSVYVTHLPPKFHKIKTSAPLDEVEVVVVHSSGELKIELRENFFLHESQWTHYDGKGGYASDGRYVPDLSAPKDQGMGRRWSHLPWTSAMEESCRQLKLNGQTKNEVPENKNISDGRRRSKRFTHVIE